MHQVYVKNTTPMLAFTYIYLFVKLKRIKDKAKKNLLSYICMVFLEKNKWKGLFSRTNLVDSGQS